ncbi:Oxidoreductase [Hypocenomyce scalaris]|nr:Oxidoreductase [Hypocenomyce scalaris]
MSRPASRSLLRQSLPVIRAARAQRLLSTAPPAQRARSWKSSAVRWGLAIGGLYYYNTSNAFAEQPSFPIAETPEEETTLPTVDSILHSHKSKSSTTFPPSPSSESLPPPWPSSQASATTTAIPEHASPKDPPRTPEEYEEEAGQQGAFNEETGEINWDCPCLGGMAHGPCGEQFRAAFSCFVYSKEEPKGMDCIDKFKGMQDCFRDHPDIYGSELEDDEEGQEEGVPPAIDSPDAKPQTPSLSPSADSGAGQTPSQPSPSPAPESGAGQTPTESSSKSAASKPTSTSAPSPMHTSAEHPSPEEKKGRTERAKSATKQVQEEHAPRSESDELVPKEAFDARGSNEGK